MTFSLPKIYPITDTRISALSHADQIRRLIDGGATLMQLRDKTALSGELYDAALECVDVVRRAQGTRLIINDRVDIAIATRADGVHLGQDDLPPDRARDLLGQDAVIGFSTHSVDQARRAVTLPIDYIAVGPIFQTSTKHDHEPVIGLDGLRLVRETVGRFPLVAIGGITRENARSVLSAGADSIALIRDILDKPSEITGRMRALANLE